MNYGVDFLGGARYQKTVLQEQPRKFGFGVFAEVDGFGKAYQLIKQVDGLGLPFIRVQLMWKDDHNFRPADIKAIENRSKKIASLGLKTKLYISPCCEHNLNEAQFEPFAQAVRKHLPNAIIVNSPNKGRGFVSRKYLNEYHHEDKPRSGGRYAFSYDGANCVDSDITKHKAVFKDAEYFMLWNSQCNGRRNLTDKTPRKDRKFWPTDKQIDSWVWLTRDKGATNYPTNFIGKSHADQHTMPPSGKDQKPVHITPLNVRPTRLHLKAKNGQTIATSTARQPYNEKTNGVTGRQIGWRYYFDSGWGFELAQKAIRIHNSPICDLFGDNKKLATVNPAFRDGKYR